jgi:hypothetical protein
MARSHPILGIYQPFYGWYIQVVVHLKKIMLIIKIMTLIKWILNKFILNDL